ncbi:MAG TPA: hypothetical protein VK968_16585 [Roseimicrobium sp.]|nr:hypothetical protein [Roseimicrobium sp.]
MIQQRGTVVQGAPNTAIITNDKPGAGPSHRMLIGMNTLERRGIHPADIGPSRSVEFPKTDFAEVNRVRIKRIHDDFVIVPQLVTHRISGC